MEWKSFHHPDWSLPVVRRRVSEKWMDFLLDVGEALASNGRSLVWNKTYPNLSAYHNSMSRLRKAGLIVRSDNDGKLPLLRLSTDGRARLPDYLQPERFWDMHWKGIWYMLIFDVPERERHYRDTLRRFLKKMRMGCLQKSVWITPRDIRPEYDDLETAASIHTVSYLLETRTVLHRETQELVQDAWNFSWLRELHSHYLSVYEKNLQMLENGTQTVEELILLLHQEAEAYAQCMQSDPLLPAPLLPKDYLGRKVYELHGKTRTAIAHKL